MHISSESALRFLSMIDEIQNHFKNVSFSSCMHIIKHVEYCCFDPRVTAQFAVFIGNMLRSGEMHMTKKRTIDPVMIDSVAQNMFHVLPLLKKRLLHIPEIEE